MNILREDWAKLTAEEIFQIVRPIPEHFRRPLTATTKMEPVFKK